MTALHTRCARSASPSIGGRLTIRYARTAAAALILFLFWAYPLYSQESQGSIDDLFAEPDTEQDDGNGEETSSGEEDTADTSDKDDTKDETPDPEEDPEEAEAPAASSEAVNIGALTTSPVKFSGSVSANLGAGIGLIEWPGTTAAEKLGDTVPDLMRYSGFYTTSAKFTVDARPASYLRFRSSLKASLNEESMIFDGPTIGELFIDYTLKDTVFFRAGTQNLTWGQGRLLGNPANLVSRVSDGVAFRTTFPAGPGTINSVIYSKSSWTDDYGELYDPRIFAYAGQWETTLGPLAMAFSGHLKTKDDDDQGEDIGGAVSLSYGLGPFDIAADAAGQWDRENKAWAPVEWDALAQLFWESDSRSWSLLSEYRFDSRTAGGKGHHAGLALRMPSLADGGWRPALRWKHAFQDNSGEVVAAASGTIAPKLKLSVGIPVIYGTPGTYYRDALEEGVEDTDNQAGDEDYTVPLDNVVSLLLSIGLSFSF